MKIPLKIPVIALLVLFISGTTSCINNPGDPIETRVTYEVVVYDNPTNLNPMEDVEVLIGSQKSIPGGSLEGTVQVVVFTNSLGRATITSTYELFRDEQIEFVALLPGCTQAHCTVNEIVSYTQAEIWADGASMVSGTVPESSSPDALFIAP